MFASLGFALSAALTGDQFQTWGWRIPFAISFVLVIYGYFLRRRITESPLFTKAVRHRPVRVPLATVLRKHPKAVLLGMLWVLASAASATSGWSSGRATRSPPEGLRRPAC